jgi:hypothetical protein
MAERELMKRAELIQTERARHKAFSLALWIFGFVILGGMIAIPSLADLSPSLATFTGNSWLAPLIVGVFLIAIWNHFRMSRCPRCRRTLIGSIAITTDRCGRCGQIALDDPRVNGK